MKVDFAWPAPLISTVTYDRQVSVSFLLMSSDFSSSLHPWTSKVILRCASAALADPRAAPHHLSSLSACPTRQKKKLATYCMSAADALSSPPSSIVCTTTSLHKHSWTHTLSHTHTERNTSSELRKIWVAQQEQGVRNYSDWCSVLTFTENGWEIMEKCDIQSGNITAAAWCLPWSRIKETGLVTLYSKAQVWLEFIEQQHLQYH